LTPGTEPSVVSSIREIAKPPGTGPKCIFAVVMSGRSQRGC
jgi:hypothetical protein